MINEVRYSGWEEQQIKMGGKKMYSEVSYAVEEKPSNKPYSEQV